MGAMLLICDSECILSARLVFFSQCFQHYFFQHSLCQSPLYFPLEYCSFSSQRSQEGTYTILRCWHRGTESEEQIQKRLRNAKAELERAKDSTLFDHILINAKLDEAYENLKVSHHVDVFDKYAGDVSQHTAKSVCNLTCTIGFDLCYNLAGIARCR
jgi:hypothetical protein